MDKKVKRYFQLKQKQKEAEQELSELRNDIISYCSEQGLSELEIGRYRVKIINQERKEYDDSLLYNALPDPSLWKMISKADSTKISGLMKLNVISDDVLIGTFSTKNVSSLQVEKK
jgi:hypothetical protein